MFPIRDHNPSLKPAYATYGIIALNVAVFLYELMFVQTPDQQWDYYLHYAFFPVLVSEGESYISLITHMFMHGGVMHLAGNMLFLWIYGDNMEEAFGHVGFLIFYLLSGLAAAFLQYIPEPMSEIPMVGASGAIAGVMGGYLLLFPKARVDVFFFFIIIIRIIPVPAWIVLGLWFILQMFSTFSVDSSMGGVAYFAHIGGFIAGMIMTLPIWLRRGGQTFWQRTEGHPPHPAARYRIVQSSVPQVRRRRR